VGIHVTHDAVLILIISRLSLLGVISPDFLVKISSKDYNGGRSNGTNKGANVMQRIYWLLSFFFLCCLIIIYIKCISRPQKKKSSFSFESGGGISTTTSQGSNHL
jgi:preprotein translocase subunit SecG